MNKIVVLALSAAVSFAPSVSFSGGGPGHGVVSYQDVPRPLSVPEVTEAPSLTSQRVAVAKKSAAEAALELVDHLSRSQFRRASARAVGNAITIYDIALTVEELTLALNELGTAVRFRNIQYFRDIHFDKGMSIDENAATAINVLAAGSEVVDGNIVGGMNGIIRCDIRACRNIGLNRLSDLEYLKLLTVLAAENVGVSIEVSN